MSPLLPAGIGLWWLVHLFPSALPGERRRLQSALGQGPYRIAFSVLTVAALTLVVLGWRGSVPQFIYLPPTWGRHLAMLLVLVAFILFAGSHMKTNLRRWVRHPQLTGLATWAAAHLLANGDSRSLVLFGGLGLWALVAIPMINRREGAWDKPEPVAAGRIVLPVVAGAVVYGVLFWAHPWFAGVRLY